MFGTRATELLKTVQNLSHLFKQSLYISDFVFKRFCVLSLVAIFLSVPFGSMKAMFSRAHYSLRTTVVTSYRDKRVKSETSMLREPAFT